LLDSWKRAAFVESAVKEAAIPSGQEKPILLHSIVIRLGA